MAGFIFALLLWPARKMFSSSELRAAVFLALLFASLLLMHAWAAIGNNYCVYCFASYLAFFSLSSILLVTLVLRVAVRQLDPARQALLALAVIIISLGIGYSAVEDIGNNLLELNIPLLGGGRISPGFITLGKLLSNKFALERTAAERILSTAVGALLAAAFLGIAWLVYMRLRKSGYSYGYVLAVSVLLLGLLFSPVMEASGARRDCPDMDVIRANEQVGHYLAETIPAGKMTYWNGGLSVAPLLHAAAVHIYLPQINDGYARRIGGDAGQLLEYGFWNDELDARWMQQADFIIVEGWRYTAMKDALPASTFDELPRSPVQTSCVDRSRLRVFQRK
jgi:hypothetical protein